MSIFDIILTALYRALIAALALLAIVVIVALAAGGAGAQETAGEFFAKDRARVEWSQARGTSRRGASIRVGIRAGRIAAHAGVRLGGVHPRLRAFAAEFGLTVISGYRPGARVRGSGRVSNHARGLAIDVRGGRMGAAIVAARARGMGIGTYSRCSGHAHVHFSLSIHERYHAGCGRRHRRR